MSAGSAAAEVAVVVAGALWQRHKTEPGYRSPCDTGDMDRLLVKRLSPHAQLPRQAHSHDAGYDVCCVEDFSLAPGQRRLVGTGLAMAFPVGWACLVVPRSGLALGHGISIVNAPGLVDAGYRNELGVILINTSTETFQAQAGERIAQLLFVPAAAPTIDEVEDLPSSGDGRDQGGFGSSGRN